MVQWKFFLPDNPGSSTAAFLVGMLSCWSWLGIIVPVQKAFETLDLYLSYRHGMGSGNLQWSLPEVFLQSWQEKMVTLQKELLEGEEGKEKEPFPSFVLSTVNLSV